MTAREPRVEWKREHVLEIGKILLIEVVGYSKLLADEQIELLQELNQIVRNTECFRSAEASGHPSLASLNSRSAPRSSSFVRDMERIVPRHAVAEPRRSTR